MVNTFREIWAAAAVRYAGRPVVVSAHDDSRFGYDDVNLLVLATVAYFHSLGLKPGDTIAIQADNHPEYLFVIWAALLSGLVVAPVDCDLPAPASKAIMERLGPKLIFCDVDRLSLADDMGVDAVIFDHDDDYGDPRVFSRQITDFMGLAPPPLADLNGSELAVILFTSGSSGPPKGVTLEQRALCQSGALMAQSYGWSADDTVLSLGAMHAMSGLRNPAMTATVAGATVLVVARHHRAVAPVVAELCHHHNATIVTSTPAFLHNLISEQRRWQPSQMGSVRMIMVTGAGLDQKTVGLAADLTGAKILNYYGLTETCGLCCFVPLNHPQQGDGVIGRAVGAEATIVDENGALVADGGTGELRIRSENLMRGYLADPGLSEIVLRNGWFYTGDLARRGEDGMLYLIGRKDGRVKSRGGEIVYPDAVSLAIHQHNNVISAAICSAQTDQLQHELIAFVVLKQNGEAAGDPASSLRRWVHERLGPVAVPLRFEFRNSLPLTSSGKIDHGQLMRELQRGT